MLDIAALGAGAEDKRFWQHSPEWSGLPLGSAGTIGEYGAALCCAARMLWRVRGEAHYWSPAFLNQWLQENRGYSGGNLLVWSALDALGLVKFRELREWPSPVSDEGLADLFSFITAGGHIIIETNFDPRQRKVRLPHYLYVEGIVADLLLPEPALLCYCPYYGKMLNPLGRYTRYHKSLRNVVWGEARFEVRAGE